MATGTDVTFNAESASQTAFKLMQIIADVEKRELYGHGKNPVDRKWVLETYDECARAVRMTTWHKA